MSMDFTSLRLALPAPLLTAVLHPTEPLLATGLSSGHVLLHRLPSTTSTDAAASRSEEADSDSDSDSDSPEEQNSDEFQLLWKTRRHNPTVRALQFLPSGSLISAGTDTLIKICNPLTGQVTSKFALPVSATNQKKRAGDPSKQIPESAIPTVLTALSDTNILVGTEAGRVLQLDPRTTKGFTGSSWGLADDYSADTVSALVPLPGLEGGEARQVVATGGVVLSVFDVRKPDKTIVTSEMQEDDILSCCYVPYWPGRTGQGNSRGRILTGMAEGMVGVWRRGEWLDHGDRVNVCRREGDSVDSIVGVDGVGIVCGTGGGKVRVVKVGGNKVLGEMVHSEVDGVGFVGADCEGRVVSGGGEGVRVWVRNRRGKKTKGEESEEEDSDESGSESEEDSESELDSEEEHARRKRKRKGLGARKGPRPTKNVKMTFEGLE